MGGPRRSDDEVLRRRGLVSLLKDRGIKQKAISEKLGVPLRTIQRDYEAIISSLYERLKAERERLRDRLECFSDEELIKFMLGTPEERKALWEEKTG